MKMFKDIVHFIKMHPEVNVSLITSLYTGKTFITLEYFSLNAIVTKSKE
jgi:hypothetical protein